MRDSECNGQHQPHRDVVGHAGVGAPEGAQRFFHGDGSGVHVFAGFGTHFQGAGQLEAQTLKVAGFFENGDDVGVEVHRELAAIAPAAHHQKTARHLRTARTAQRGGA